MARADERLPRGRGGRRGPVPLTAAPPPLPLVYRQTGAYDADTEVQVEADGAFTVEGGGYATRGRRAGRLGPRDLGRVVRLAERVEARDWGVPPAAEGFVHALDLGGRHVRWWGPAADVDADLAALVRALSTL